MPVGGRPPAKVERRHAALGAGQRQPGARERPLDEKEARHAFLRLFDGELEALERGFRAWVEAGG